MAAVAQPIRPGSVAAWLFAAALAFGTFGAEASEPRHGLSAFGDLKYPAEFEHFDYVNPDAPKGGRFSLIGWGGVTTFNSLNPYILKGDAAQGMEMLFDSLMTRAQDEPDAVYGLVAKSGEVADDGMSVTFKLRPEARFQDGSPLTAEDVAFSFETLKEKGHPLYRQMLRDVEKAEALDDETVRYRFKGNQTRDLPLTVATLPIFSKAYYADKDFAETTLEAPLGSGPYTVEGLHQGRNITYKRDPDYWGKDLPVNRGRWNFDEIRFEYFRDRTAAMEAFKSGAYDFREEFTSKVWATEYDFPAITSGRVKKATLPDDTPSGTQGWFLNTRRDALKDPKVREALGLAFDFEWTNRNLFYGLYDRTQSYFENSAMRAEGEPTDKELALLDTLSAPVPEAAKGEAYAPPVTDGSGHDRALLKKADALLREAGWTVKNGVRVNEDGEPLKLEFLNFEPAFERVTAPYIRNLQRLGIQARMRMVDPSQYQQRLKGFDFDVVTQRYGMELTPGPELRSYFGSEAADMTGSLNLAGIANPAADELISDIIEAKSRGELVTAARALDRVLRAGHYWVPHWYKGTHTVAYWDKFSQPEQKPRFDRGILDTWWYDEAKAEALAGSAAADSQMAANAKPDAPRDPLQEDEPPQKADQPEDDGFAIGYLIAALVFAGLLVLVVVRFRKRRLD
ncbi:Oligopeptide-binding protein AppA precursor [Methyloligella halotolerans]|uniref:Oligopeptide-binding protein AppA n=1 Tax=Methyloligella halotolerans TaxID=1177755 RepID=A0A1E2RWA6_9HYPH|nr:extracellular solute-binding protein [Methyloligella halotolerans]ODA66405.1 Oligopeptide-binding protein AppA precursor [Methyloligella halotolerans]